MARTVRLDGNRVAEILPEYALPPEKWYGLEFAKICVEAPDDVKLGWVYDSDTGGFSPYAPAPVPAPPIEVLQAENKLLKAQVQAQTERADFVEECLAEMATIVYV